jgi:hypothetical protein
MALPAWFWQHLPFVVLALALPTQMLSNHFTIPDRNFATENVSRAFDQAINRAEDAVLTIAETLESYGLAGDFLEYIPHLHRPKLPPRDKRTVCYIRDLLRSELLPSEY